MRRALLILSALALVACVGFTQDILYRDTATFEWNEVTVDLNGDPLLPTDTVQYDVYLYDFDNPPVDIQDTALLTAMGRTSLTSMDITFPSRITWVAGVRVSVIDVDANETLSDIAWSTEPIPVTAVGPFTYVPVLDGLTSPQGLRDSLQ